MNKESIRNLFNNVLRFHWTENVINETLVKVEDKPYLMGYADALRDTFLKVHLTEYFWNDKKYVPFTLNAWRKWNSNAETMPEKVLVWTNTNDVFYSARISPLMITDYHFGVLMKLSIKKEWFST